MIVVVIGLDVVNYAWGAGCVYLLLVDGSMMEMYGVLVDCVMAFCLDVVNYAWVLDVFINVLMNQCICIRRRMYWLTTI